MDKKLTLSLDASVIDKAKMYAKKQETSLSKMIENYLSVLTDTDDKDGIEITPLVKSIIGVASLPEDYDFRSDYADYLSKKYQ